MKECDGSGICLEQSGDCNTYIRTSGFLCKYDCKPIPCVNAIICETILPPWFLGLKKAGICICISCDSTFRKKLEVVENTECPMCLDTKTCVIQPNCTHPTCVDCFKRCVYGQPDTPEPLFPYSDEIQTEWEEGGCDNPEWCARYPLAQKWEAEWKAWEYARDMKFYREQNLRVCPICRR